MRERAILLVYSALCPGVLHGFSCYAALSVRNCSGILADSEETFSVLSPSTTRDLRVEFEFTDLVKYYLTITVVEPIHALLRPRRKVLRGHVRYFYQRNKQRKFHVTNA